MKTKTKPERQKCQFYDDFWKRGCNGNALGSAIELPNGKRQHLCKRHQIALGVYHGASTLWYARVEDENMYRGDEPSKLRIEVHSVKCVPHGDRFWKTMGGIRLSHFGYASVIPTHSGYASVIPFGNLYETRAEAIDALASALEDVVEGAERELNRAREQAALVADFQLAGAPETANVDDNKKAER